MAQQDDPDPEVRIWDDSEITDLFQRFKKTPPAFVSLLDYNSLTQERDTLRAKAAMLQSQLRAAEDGRALDRMNAQAEYRAENKRLKAALASKTNHIRHGIDCKRVEHIGGGYLHASADDSPYDVDGVMYCGRCHVAF